MGEGHGTGAMQEHGAMLPPLQWGSFTRWELQPWWLLFAVLVLTGYLVAVVIARRHQVASVHPVRVASFVAGIGLLVLTVSSAVHTYAMALFWDHMIEHLLLIMVVPALLVLGHPVTAVRAAAAAHGRERLVDAVATSRPVRVLTHPVAGFLLYATVIVGTHLTGFMDAMATHSWLMEAEGWLYLVTGFVYLLPLLGAEPVGAPLPYLGRIGLLLVGMTPDTVVGIVLLQTNYDMFPVMEAGHPGWAPPPVQDVQTAGALMWLVGDGLMMLFAVGVIIALIAHPRSTMIVGRGLEGVRRRTLAEHIALSGGELAGEDVDVDEDDAALDAYNQMLGRLSGRPSPQEPRD